MTHRISILIAITFLTGCGIADIERIAGTWEYTSGSGTMTCLDSTEAIAATGTAVFSVGVDSDLVLNNEPCFSKFDVEENEAWARPGQDCTVHKTTYSGTPYTLTMQPTNWTYRVSDDGSELYETQQGSIEIDNQGRKAICSYSTSSALRKITR